jgi:hypothetical protein
VGGGGHPGSGGQSHRGSHGRSKGEDTMALTTLQVEQAGTGKPKSLGPGKHHDEHGLYVEVRNPTSKSWSTRGTFKSEEIWIGIGSVKDISSAPAS